MSVLSDVIFPMSIEVSPLEYPLLRALAAIDAGLDDGAELDPGFVATPARATR
jgi:hypothetical protein